MHKKFVKFLVDPETKEQLILEDVKSIDDNVLEGFLSSSRNKYPIVRGIPRFVKHDIDNYSKSFGYQWNKWARIQFEEENIGRPMEGHTRNMWEKITGFFDHEIDIKNKIVVDIGCGPGRFVDIAREKGALVIGVDFSSAVEAAYKNFENDSNVCIVQADALKLPINDSVVDGAFSIGVLHHTPNPSVGVKEASRILKKDGWFAISVYGKGGYYDFPTVQLWRRFFKLIWPIFKHYPPLIYSFITVYLLRPIAYIPILGKAVRVFLPFVKLPDIRWSFLDTFDSVTPSYQSAHTSYEIFNWFKSNKFKDIEPTNWGFTAFFGKK